MPDLVDRYCPCVGFADAAPGGDNLPGFCVNCQHFETRHDLGGGCAVRIRQERWQDPGCLKGR